MSLTPEQFGKFHAALLDAYSTTDLKLMLRLRLGQHLEDMADPAQARPNIVSDLIGKTENQGEAPILRLIDAALQSRPENLKLVRFAREFGPTALSISTQSHFFAFEAVNRSLSPALERQVRERVPSLDFDHWAAGGCIMQSRVCQVVVNEPGKVARGTGFLVGPEVVLTNYHVVAPVIKGQVAPSAVTLRFDFKFLSNGTRLNNGIPFQLVNNKDKWLIDSSPNSKMDTQVSSGDELPRVDELDYALLRVDGTPGDMPLDAGSIDVPAKKRGWIKVPAGPVSFQYDDPVLILQHLAGGPVKLAIETKAILPNGVNANGTRVRYTTNTEHGSSGAPCFDLEWHLLALHHSGDNSQREGQWNEGIPIDAIVNLANAHLQARGLSSPWGKQE